MKRGISLVVLVARFPVAARCARDMQRRSLNHYSAILLTVLETDNTFLIRSLAGSMAGKTVWRCVEAFSA